MSIAAEADFEWLWRSKIVQNGLKLIKKVIRKRLEKTIDFETDFQSILDRFLAAI